MRSLSDHDRDTRLQRVQGQKESIQRLSNEQRNQEDRMNRLQTRMSSVERDAYSAGSVLDGWGEWLIAIFLVLSLGGGFSFAVSGIAEFLSHFSVTYNG